MYLIDTSIFVYSLRGDRKVAEQLSRRLAEPRALSVITYGELLWWAMKSARSIENVAKVRRIAELYPVIDVSVPIIETFAVLRARLEQEGRRLDDFDLVIAATALHMGYALVTDNIQHFERVEELRIENWAA